MNIELFSQLITYLVFGWIGYVWAKNLSRPARLVDWLLWLIALWIVGSIRLRIVDIFGFTIFSQDLLQALVLGVLINFILRLARSELFQAKTKS